MKGRVWLPLAIKATGWALSHARVASALLGTTYVVLTAVERALAEEDAQRAIREAEADGAFYCTTEGHA